MAFQMIFKNYIDILMVQQLLRFLEFRFLLSLSGTGWGTDFPNNLALYFKDLKVALFPMTAIKLVSSCFE